MHERDKPDSIIDLLYSDGLTSEDLAEIDLLALEADSTARGDGDGFVVERIFELRQALVSTRRRAIQVGRKPELLKRALKYRKGINRLCGGQRVTGNQVAGCEVCDGERITIAFVGEHELAFVVRAPQIIWFPGLGQRGTLGAMPA